MTIIKSLILFITLVVVVSSVYLSVKRFIYRRYGGKTLLKVKEILLNFRFGEGE